jgi:hypothetical protein
MHINHNVPVGVEQVIDTFARQNPTRMQFCDIFNDHEDNGNGTK